jgi:hypothetical protein
MVYPFALHVGCSDEEEGMAEVQLLLKRVMAHKKVTSRKKEMQILQVSIYMFFFHGRRCTTILH